MVRVFLVLFTFLGVPAGVWWVASPMIVAGPIDPSTRAVLGLFVTSTLIIGIACLILVMQDLAAEPD